MRYSNVINTLLALVASVVSRAVLPGTKFDFPDTLPNQQTTSIDVIPSVVMQNHGACIAQLASFVPLPGGDIPSAFLGYPVLASAVSSSTSSKTGTMATSATLVSSLTTSSTRTTTSSTTASTSSAAAATASDDSIPPPFGSSPPPPDTMPPFSSFGEDIGFAAFASEPDKARETFVFTGNRDETICGRDESGAAPYIAGHQYIVIVATYPAFIYSEYPRPVSYKSAVSANYYYFDAECNPSGPVALEGDYQAAKGNIIAKLSLFDAAEEPPGKKVETYIVRSYYTECGTLIKPPAFTKENCGPA